MRNIGKTIRLLIFTIFFVFCATGCGDITELESVYLSQNESEIQYDVQTEIQNQTENTNPTEVNQQTEYTNQIQTETKTQVGSTANSLLEVHFIDVGQADAILIKDGDNFMMIDAGNNDDADLIKKYLSDKGVKKLDYVIGTHPHEDHIGSLDTVINNFDVGTIIMPNKFTTTKTFEDVISAIERKGLLIDEAKAGNKYTLGDSEFTVLSPAKDYGDELNNASVVIRLVHGDNSFLFTGDAEIEPEGDILKAGYELKSDVLKFGHHGSSTSTSREFLSAVSPKYGVIMCGKDNSYGHPHDETLAKIKRDNIKVYRTDENGTIIATSDGKNISWNQADIKDTSQASDIKNAASQTVSYILNTNSKKFHNPSCSSAKKISAKNKKEYQGTRDALILDGYSACGICKP